MGNLQEFVWIVVGSSKYGDMALIVCCSMLEIGKWWIFHRFEKFKGL